MKHGSQSHLEQCLKMVSKQQQILLFIKTLLKPKRCRGRKKYNGEVSSLPLGESILQHVGEVLRQCEDAKLASGGWVGGDAWFGLIPAVVELKKVQHSFNFYFQAKHPILSQAGTAQGYLGALSKVPCWASCCDEGDRFWCGFVHPGICIFQPRHVCC